MGLGASSLFRGRTADAIEHLEKAIELAPNFEAPYLFLAVAQVQEGMPLAAVQSARRALRLNPRAPVLYQGPLALANMQAGRTQEAIGIWERIRAANPDSTLSRIALADHYEGMGRHEDARVIAREILRINPDLTAEQVAQAYGRLRGGELAHLEENMRSAGLP